MLLSFPIEGIGAIALKEIEMIEFGLFFMIIACVLGLIICEQLIETEHARKIARRRRKRERARRKLERERERERRKGDRMWGIFLIIMIPLTMFVGVYFELNN